MPTNPDPTPRDRDEGNNQHGEHSHHMRHTGRARIQRVRELLHELHGMLMQIEDELDTQNND